MKQAFSFPLRTEEAVDDAVAALFWWREQNDLELSPAECRRRRLKHLTIDPEIYSSCSSNTQQLGDILVDYVMLGDCDDRHLNFYPLLDRIIAWMDRKYSSPSSE